MKDAYGWQKNASISSAFFITAELPDDKIQGVSNLFLVSLMDIALAHIIIWQEPLLWRPIILHPCFFKNFDIVECDCLLTTFSPSLTI